MAWVVSVFVWLYGGLFALAGVGKIDAWPAWTELVGRFPFSRRVQRATRIAVPLVELAVMATVWITPRLGLQTAAALLAALAVASVLLKRSVGARECNCFGATASAKLGWALAGRNFALAAGAIALSVEAGRENLAAPAPTALIGLVCPAGVLLGSEYRRIATTGDGRGPMGARE